MNELKNLLLKFYQLTKKLKIDYVIVGAFSLFAWGRIRATRDIDIILERKNMKKKMEKFLEEAEKLNLVIDKDDFKKSFEKGGHFSIFNKNSIFYLDCKFAFTNLDEETLKDKVVLKIFEKRIKFSSPEILIISKLIFGSSKDLEDVRSILIRSWKKIDFKKLEKFAKKYKIKRKLEKILKSFKNEN